MSPRLAFLFLLVGCYVSYVIRLKPISNLPCIFICFGQTLPLAGWLPAAFTNQSFFQSNRHTTVQQTDTTSQAVVTAQRAHAIHK